MRTKKWTRSPQGKVFGVAAGLAEWRDLPVRTVQLIVFLTILFTGFFPGAAIYLLVALCLPSQSPEDIIDERSSYSSRTYQRHYSSTNNNYQDAQYEESSKSTDDLKEEYENLKKKVEKMEGQMFDKEKDWDQRFNGDQK